MLSLPIWEPGRVQRELIFEGKDASRSCMLAGSCQVCLGMRKSFPVLVFRLSILNSQPLTLHHERGELTHSPSSHKFLPARFPAASLSFIQEPLLLFQLAMCDSEFIPSKWSDLLHSISWEKKVSSLSCCRNPLKSPKQQRARGFKRVDTHHRALKYSPPRSPWAHTHNYIVAHTHTCKKKQGHYRWLLVLTTLTVLYECLVYTFYFEPQLE